MTMDTINTYLDNVFAALPKTAEVLRARQELQAGMEEKYLSLKAEGKSESEAISTVISEFGNIDELIAELGVPAADEAAGEALPVLERETAMAFLATNRQAARMISLGVFCCILGVALMFLTHLLLGSQSLPAYFSVGVAEPLGLIPLLVFVAIGVGLFIFAGFQKEKYAWLEQGFVLAPGLKQDLEKQYEQFMPTFTVAMIVGVGLCILSPIALFLSAVFPAFRPEYGLVILLAIVAVAVYLFVRFGMAKDGFARLLQLGEYVRTRPKNVKKSSKADKITSVVASVIFPLATAAYLLMGFLGNLWHPGWLIFPITGILYAVFSSIVEATVGK